MTPLRAQRLLPTRVELGTAAWTAEATRGLRVVVREADRVLVSAPVGRRIKARKRSSESRLMQAECGRPLGRADPQDA